MSEMETWLTQTVPSNGPSHPTPTQVWCCDESVITHKAVTELTSPAITDGDVQNELQADSFYIIYTFI